MKLKSHPILIVFLIIIAFCAGWFFSNRHEYAGFDGNVKITSEISDGALRKVYISLDHGENNMQIILHHTRGYLEKMLETEVRVNDFTIVNGFQGVTETEVIVSKIPFIYHPGKKTTAEGFANEREQSQSGKPKGSAQ